LALFVGLAVEQLPVQLVRGRRRFG
jgi:hypothetical protein